MLKIPSYRISTLALLIFIAIGSLAAWAQIPGFGGAEKTELKDLNDIPQEEVYAYLSTLSDAQARELLITQVNNRQALKSAPSMMDSSYISYTIMSLHDRSERFETEFKKISYASQHYGNNLGRVLEAMFFTGEMSAIPKISLTLLILLIVGGLIVTFAFRPIHDFRHKLTENGNYPVYVRLRRSIAGLALDLAQVGLFVVVTVPLTFLFFDELDPVRVLAASVLILVATIWAIRNILKEMLYSPVNRDLYIKDDQCRRIYYWSMLGFFVPTVLSLLLQGLLGILGFPSELIRLNSLVLASCSILSLIIGVFLIAREKNHQHDTEPDIIDTAVSHNKQWLIVAVLIIFYVIFFKNIVTSEDPTGESHQPSYTYFALLMFIFMPMYLRLVYLLITIQPTAVTLGKEHKSEGIPVEDLKPHKWVRIIFVAPYIILIFLFTMEGANIGLLSWFSEGGGAHFGQGATSVFVASMLGVIAWNVVNTYINKHLPDIALDPTALMGAEVGGDDAATRMQTVLPIARNFALALIVVVVTFSVLSSMGVNTAPLLAGAGVIGIAIGFGAQKLVQDVVSGMFFLFEDAFRIGEYIDTGSLVGTVESTSVRSLKLRHHLGAVQTIPYGEIRSVKNLSRDFVIMKLKFRVPFNTDIELVRKTIKKVGQALLQDEELGENFIAPLKSQGIQTAEDDALVLRMKFTCKPGKQWMIKRSAYHLVQEALAKEGIHFASRQVTVHVPDNENSDTSAIKQAAGAAALAIDSEKSNKPADPLADI